MCKLTHRLCFCLPKTRQSSLVGERSSPTMFCFKKKSGSYTPPQLPNEEVSERPSEKIVKTTSRHISERPSSRVSVRTKKRSNERKNQRRSRFIQPAERLRRSEENILKTAEKTKEQKALIKKAIEDNEFLFKIINGRCLDQVVNAVYPKYVSANEVIITEGKKGDNMYISQSGTYKVTSKGKELETFHEGRVFGELAILYNDYRLATVKAVTNGQIWVLEQRVFNHLTQVTEEQEEKERVAFLKQVKNLNKANDQVLQQVASLLKKTFFEPNKKIFRQGDKGDKFYIITAGQVIISKEGEGVVGRVGKGKYFGELALLAEDARTATVQADEKGVECLTLTRQEFLNFFGEVKDFSKISISKQKEEVPTLPIENKYKDTTLNDLKIIGVLGEGAFGTVALVQHKKDKTIFALKYLQKYKIRPEQHRYIFSEKEIQTSLNSPFIIRLYATFKNSRYVYFLLEVGLGGDLFNLLINRPNKRFSDSEAQFITACVLEAFTCLHVKNIVYRDLKPENLLIDYKGYIKLADFGISKILTSSKKTFSFVGSPEYIAPEILTKAGHHISADYWTVGIFIHELLTGRTPFKDSNSRVMYQKILSGIEKVRFSSTISKQAKDLIIKLCHSQPEYRLGMQKNGINDIKNHKWFQSFDWRKLQEQKIKSPIDPKLKDDKDYTNTKTTSTEQDQPPEDNSGWDKDF